MFSTLRGIISDNWAWRGQVWRLAITELQKQVRGAVLGWIWLFATPLIYIGVFWFALEIGLKKNSPVDGIPFVVWLSCGLIPWFFMNSMITTGANVYRRYSYLVNRLRFPISVISTFYTMAQFITFLLSMIIVGAVMAMYRIKPTLYAIQVPFVAVIMMVFWTTWSMMMSPLSALSKDLFNLIKAMSMPLFWLSGTIFRISTIENPAIRWVLAFNPISFFVTSFRASLCEDFWIWEDHRLFYPFLGVFVLLIIGAIRVQSRLSTEVCDVL